MAAALITLATTLIGLLFWFIKRKATAADDALQQNRNRYAQIEKDIARGDANAATLHATGDLDELERVLDRKAH